MKTEINSDAYNELQIKINDAFPTKKQKPKAVKVFSIRLVDKHGIRLAKVKRYIGT